MKKRLYIIGVLLLFVICCICYKSLVTNSNENKKQIELMPINTEAIALEIKRSNMPDGGYRFATAEFKEQLSVYATYYIREAKKSAVYWMYLPYPMK